MCERQVAGKRVLALSKIPGTNQHVRFVAVDERELRTKNNKENRFCKPNLHSSGVCRSRRKIDRGDLELSTLQGSQYSSEEIPQ
jgi:hypothetical protein